MTKKNDSEFGQQKSLTWGDSSNFLEAHLMISSAPPPQKSGLVHPRSRRNAPLVREYFFSIFLKIMNNELGNYAKTLTIYTFFRMKWMVAVGKVDTEKWHCLFDWSMGFLWQGNTILIAKKMFMMELWISCHL